ACIFMFTGEWPTDWSTLFDQAAYLPINSSGMVFPVTRRWQAYDANTGYSRYVYKVAYSLFAGSALHYELKLGCSGAGVACIDENGMEGPCDCGRTGVDYTMRINQFELPIMKHGSGNCPESGNMAQGQSCTDEILFVTDPGQPLRYDKVYLYYTPTVMTGKGGYGAVSSQGTGVGGAAAGGTGIGGNMADASALSGRLEGTIREISGPPPGFCEFDAFDVSFKCGFDVPETGYARFLSAEPTKEPNEPFGIGESDIVDAKIAQRIPPDTASCGSQDCEFTKYLVLVEIRNQNEAKIYPPNRINPVGERLNEETIHQFSVPDDLTDLAAVAEESFKIKREHFAMTKEASANVRVRDGSGPEPKTKEMISTQLRNYIIGAIEPRNVRPPATIRVMYFEDQWWYITGKILQTSGISETFENTGERVTCGFPDRLNDQSVEVTCAGFLFVVDTVKLDKDDVRSAAMVIDYQEAEATGGAESCPEQPVEWKIVLELRDAAESGGSYQMGLGPITDAETGTLQRKIIPFKAVCKQGSSVDGSAGSLEDLKRRTAHVTSTNDEYNKTFGLWIDYGDLADGVEEIRVNNFQWNDPGEHYKGFKIDIDSTAVEAALYLDISKILLLTTEDTKIIKGGTELQPCDSGDVSPCRESYGDTKTIKIRLKAGDPTYTFNGFRDLASATPLTPTIDKHEGIVLTKSDFERKSATGTSYSVMVDEMTSDGKVIVDELNSPLNPDTPESYKLKVSKEKQDKRTTLTIHFPEGILINERFLSVELDGTKLNVGKCTTGFCFARWGADGKLTMISIHLTNSFNSGEFIIRGLTNEPPEQDDEIITGVKGEFDKCTNSGNICISDNNKDKLCKSNTISATNCDAGFVCCTPNKNVLPPESPCGPESLAGTPKCQLLSNCRESEGKVEYSKGTNLCKAGEMGGIVCCTNDVTCTTQRPVKSAVLRDIVIGNPAQGQPNMVGALKLGSGDIVHCESNTEICLPGVTSNPNVFIFGTCRSLFGAGSLEKYCDQMSPDTCIAKSGNTKGKFYDECDKKGLVKSYCKCAHDKSVSGTVTKQDVQVCGFTEPGWPPSDWNGP
ncbi:MAG: hypothetical protein V1729_04285, partial [Candidatus Woesearchaeota archaeon]